MFRNPVVRLSLSLSLAGCAPTAMIDAGTDAPSEGDAPGSTTDAPSAAITGIAAPRTPSVLYQDFDGCVVVPALGADGLTRPLVPTDAGYEIDITGTAVATVDEACGGIRLFGASAGTSHVTVRATTSAGVSTAEFDVRVAASAFELTDLFDGTEEVVARGTEIDPFAFWPSLTFASPEPDAQALFHSAFETLTVEDTSVVAVSGSHLTALAPGQSNVRMGYSSALSAGAPLVGRTVVVADGELWDLNFVVIADAEHPAPGAEVLPTVVPNGCVRIRGFGSFVDGDRYYQAFVDTYELTVTPSGRLVEREPGIWCAGPEEGEVLLHLCVGTICVDGGILVYAADAIAPELTVTVIDPTPTAISPFDPAPPACLPLRVEATIHGTRTDVSASPLLRFLRRGSFGFDGSSTPMDGRPCGRYAGAPAGTDPFTGDVGLAYGNAGTTVSLTFRPST